MTIDEEREIALASIDIDTYDDYGGSTGHVAVVLRDGTPYLTGAHDNEDASSTKYQFLIPLQNQDREAFLDALERVDRLSLGEAKSLFYYFPGSAEILRELAEKLGLATG